MIIHAAYPANAADDILIINSYHPGYRWTESIVDGIRAALAEAGSGVELHQEYMDTKRLNDEENTGNLYHLFEHKYRKNTFKAVVVTDNDAFNFIVRYRDSLFPGKPVVFCGVNFFEDSMLRAVSGFSGVAESFEGAKTVELMLRLHPRTKKIMVVIDGTTTGIALRKELESVFDRFSRRVTFEVIQNETIGRITERAARADADALVLLMPFALDSAGEYIDHSKMAEKIVAVCPVPVYGTWDFYFGYGIVGGLLTDGRSQGVAAGEIVLQVLSGADIDMIPVRRSSPASYMFDSRQLKRFKIPARLLPGGSYVGYTTWYEKNKYYVLTYALLSGLLIVSAVLMGELHRKRKESQLAARTSDERFRTLVEKAPIPIIMATDLKFSYCNASFCRMYGYAGAEEVVGTPLENMVAPDSRVMFRERAENRIKGIPQPTSYDAMGCRKDGTEFPVFITASRIDLPDGAGIIAFSQDMSDRKQAGEKIQKLLAEKELILQEVHHRIKNNMTTIYSLLLLQAGTMSDKSAEEALRDAGRRVSSMMTLYEKLYRSTDYDEIPVDQYLPALVDEIIANFPNAGSVRVVRHADPFILNVRNLQALGIIINELLTNIMKYAFAGRDDGVIAVTASLTGNLVSLVIADNGQGMPDSVSLEHPTGFGLVLVNALIGQLQGTIRIERDGGTRIILEFER